MENGATDFTLKPGDVVNGRFEVVRPLGSGGFATVYVARQLNIGREVALKLLGMHFDPRQHSEMWGRFEREARVAAQIDHPSVVTIHDYGIYDATGQPFIVMELLRGHDLEHEIDSHGPLALERALPLFGDAPPLDLASEGGECRCARWPCPGGYNVGMSSALHIARSSGSSTSLRTGRSAWRSNVTWASTTAHSSASATVRARCTRRPWTVDRPHRHRPQLPPAPLHHGLR